MCLCSACHARLGSACDEPVGIIFSVASLCGYNIRYIGSCQFTRMLLMWASDCDTACTIVNVMRPIFKYRPSIFYTNTIIIFTLKTTRLLYSYRVNLKNRSRAKKKAVCTNRTPTQLKRQIFDCNTKIFIVLSRWTTIVG